MYFLLFLCIQSDDYDASFESLLSTRTLQGAYNGQMARELGFGMRYPSFANFFPNPELEMFLEDFCALSGCFRQFGEGSWILSFLEYLDGL